MSITPVSLSQEALDAIFPAQRTDDFFDALYGEAEEGAYDIRLIFRSATLDAVVLAFELRQRPGKCLVCSLTYGLPQVFQRHPIINTAGVAREVAVLAGWDPEKITWTLGHTEEHGPELHCVALTIKKN